MDRVDETLADWRRHPHQYGVNDCVLSAATYWGTVWPAWAGTYWDAEGAERLLSELGGMHAVLEQVGGVLVDRGPVRGDIIGLASEADYPIPCLVTGDRVAARLERGVIELPLKFVRWSGVWQGAA